MVGELCFCLDERIADEIWHSCLPGDNRVDGKKDAAALLYLRPGFWSLAEYHSCAEPSYKDRIGHFDLHVTGCGCNLGFRNAHVCKVRNLNGTVVPRNNVEKYANNDKEGENKRHRSK